MTLKNSVAVVTGAASGIGRALCPLLGREGARLVLIDRDAAGLESLGAELAAANVPSASATVDVSQQAALAEAIRTTSARIGPVDLLVASAGIEGVTLVDDLAVDQAEAIVRVNFLGVVYAIDAVLPEMLQRGAGHIVGVSSLAGCRGMAFSAAYGASKAALSRYLEGLRPSLRGRGIAVSTVCPGFVRTPMTDRLPLRSLTGMISPETAARHVLKAILRRKRYYCFPRGAAIGVALLLALSPRQYDKAMIRGARLTSKLKY